MYKVNGNTTTASAFNVRAPSSQTKTAAAVLNAGASLERQQSTDGGQGRTFFDLAGSGIRKIGSFLTSGWDLGGDQAVAGIDTTPYLGDPVSRVLSGGSSTKSRGLGTLFSALLGGGTGISLGGILSGIGGFFSEKAKHKLAARRLDVQEAIGKEANAINRLQIEGNISENKRRTAIGSTFMGHTNPIAAVEGVTGIEPGLQVADQWVSPEVRKQSAGVLSGSKLGLIDQGTQRKLAS